MSDQKLTKCSYHNSGFCKFKQDCKNIHSSTLCNNSSCSDRKCPNRHPKTCRYKEKCKRITTCLYKHDNSLTDTLINVTLASDDDQLSEAHKTILSAHSTIEKLKIDFEDFKENIKHQYTNDVEKLMQEIDNTKEKEIEAEIRHKKEMMKQKKIYEEKIEYLQATITKQNNDNVDKFKHFKLKYNKEMEQNRHKNYEKIKNQLDILNKRESELQNREIKNRELLQSELKKIHIKSQNKCNQCQNKIDEKTEDEKTMTYTCNECNFKTNWMTNLKTHKKNKHKKK